MIIIRVMGGLGNQMQQYALYEKFKSMGKEVKLDISWFEDNDMQAHVLARRELELRSFDKLMFETCNISERDRLRGKDDLAGRLKRKLLASSNHRFCETQMYHPEIFDMDQAYLEGHWACERYYHDILLLLQDKIHFPKSGNPKNTDVCEEMKQINAVSIHIRRGDYLDPENAGMFGGICTDAYYSFAEQYIRERVKDARFYLFSDDTEYLKERYKGNEYTIVDWNKGSDSFYDMELMSHCRHNICANSTFSFWGARLNQSQKKIMIRPAKHKNSQEIRPEEMHELWNGWVLVDSEGKVV